MALISSSTIIASLSLFHITIGWFLISSPQTVADQGLIFVLGQAMGMPHVRAFETPSPSLAFLAYVLMLMGISDLCALAGPDYPVHLHWSTQAPVRMFISLVLMAYTFIFSPSGPLYGGKNPRGILAHPVASSRAAGYVPSSWGGDLLKNRVFFTFVFLEMVCWFWVFASLRNERAALQRNRRMNRED